VVNEQRHQEEHLRGVALERIRPLMPADDTRVSGVRNGVRSESVTIPRVSECWGTDDDYEG
jgi:hypothetical protein